MNAILTPFLRICLLRAGPQALPDSPLLLKLALIGYFVSATIYGVVAVGPAQAVPFSLAATVLLIVMVAGLLSIYRLSNRINRTLTAMAGTGTLFQLLITPLQALAIPLSAQPEAPAPDSIWMPVIWVTVGWSLAVESHILRHALSAPFTLGLLFALAFTFIAQFVVSLVLAI